MRENNFDFLRLFAASLVLYGHAHVFTGDKEPLFLSWIPLGPLAVFCFFIVSGYFVSESWDRDPSLLRFIGRRSLRIFPALAVCLLLSAFVLGPLMTTLTLDEYFKSPFVYRYLSNIFLNISFYLPGVFETNRVANAVNGSIWTLPVEFFMYIVVAVVGFFFRANRWMYVALFIATAALNLFWVANTSEMVVVYGTDLRQVMICGVYFWVGAVIYKFNLKKMLTLSNVVLAFVILICLERWLGVLKVGAWVLLPIVVLGFGFAFSRPLNKLTRMGDYSYGVYIYAFPVQQTIIYLFPDIRMLPYLTVTIGIVLVLASLSWHFVEAPALTLKSHLRDLSINSLLFSRGASNVNSIKSSD